MTVAPAVPASDTISPAGPPLRAVLMRLVWWSAGPLLLLAGALAWQHLQRVETDTAAEAQAVARHVAAEVERSLQARARGLELLAHAGDGDDPAQRADLYRLAQGYQRAFGNHVILADLQGQMLFNTRLPLGSALPRLPVPKGRSAVALALAQGKPAVGDLFMGPIAKLPLVAIAVPALGRQQVVGTWVSQHEARSFQPFLDEVVLEPGWRLALRDSTGVLIAGRGDVPATSVPADRSALRVALTLERAPWQLELEVPSAVAKAPTLKAAALLGGAGLLALGAGLLGGRQTGRRIDRALRRLSEGADTADNVEGDESPIDEVLQVQQRLAQAAGERDAALADLQSSERAYHLLFEQHPLPLWVYDQHNLRFLAVNEAAIRIYGFSRSEFLAAATLALIRPPDQLPAMDQAVRRLRERAPLDAALSRPWTHRYRDGRTVQVEMTSRALPFGGRPGRLVMAQDVTERLRAEQDLRDSERNFRVLAEQVPAIVYRARLDPPGFTDYVSPRIAELGFTPEQWLAQPDRLWQAMHPDDRERVQREVAEGFQGPREEMHLEYRIRNAEGGWRHASDHARIIRPADGSAPFVLGVNVDVTRQREAERALRRSELQFRTLAEQLPAIVYRAQADFSAPTNYVSPGIARLGYTPEQWTSRDGPNWLQVMHPQDQARVLAEVGAAVASGSELQLEYRLRDHDGQWRDFIDYGRMVTDAEGVQQMQGVMVETTPLKRTEQALRAAEAYQRSLFEALADGVLLLDRHHRVLDANPAAAQLLGYPRDELVGRRLHELLAPQEVGRIDDVIAGLLAATTPALVEWEHHRRDGSVFPAEVSARAVDATRYVKVLRDVTERRHAQRALVAYQMELSELAQQLMLQERATTRRVAQALHDQLGQSLAVARLHLDATLVSHGPRLPPEVKPACERVGRALEQAIGEVRVVLSELRPPLLEERGLVAALDNEVRSRDFDSGALDVLLEADAALASLRWPSEVEYGAFMIAREAIVNAQRHARATLVRVIVEGDAAQLRLAVHDDGLGIPETLRAGRPGHLGLVGMRERALAIGARFAIEQPASGGTLILLEWQDSSKP